MVRVVIELRACAFAGMHTRLSYLCDTYFDHERLTNFVVLVAKRLSHVVRVVLRLAKVDFSRSFLDTKASQGQTNDMHASLAALPTLMKFGLRHQGHEIQFECIGIPAFVCCEIFMLVVRMVK